jgi:hypothetical protein
VAQHGAASFEQKTLDDVEPGAMGEREGEFEAMCGLLRDPGPRPLQQSATSSFKWVSFFLFTLMNLRKQG